ncbi:MAG: efflux RND transporter periplasmic adaptor subunit [Verrucomicrobia bacterium]|nr:MAG: efflux RND transporter periplasmic adaptor subunit [Verrucomicrobiota bacterium]
MRNESRTKWKKFSRISRVVRLYSQFDMAKNGNRGWIKWVIALVVLAAAGVGAWLYKDHKDGEIEYQSVKVLRGDLTQVVTATGTLNPVINVTVGSQISGNIQKLFADFNSPVTNGQVIAQLDAATYRANVSTAAADLANANAALELAQVNARRSGELFKDKLISQSDYDTTMAALHQAEAQVLSKTAALDRAKVDLSRCTIYAPVDGMVISRNVDVGQTVAASLSAPTLFIIANDLSKMQIDANVAEADVGGVLVGQDVEFTVDAYPMRTFRGKVAQVRNAPITVQNVVTYDTVIEVHNPDLKLKPGMTANVSVVIARREGTLKIANAALRFRPPDATKSSSTTNAAPQSPAQGGTRGLGGGGEGGGRRGGGEGGGRQGGGRPQGEHQPVRTVFTLATDDTAPKGDPKLKPVQIKTGISDGIFTEIIEGLNEGDAVVTSATQPGAATVQPQSNPFGGPGGFRRF